MSSRALISVYDKSGVVELASGLIAMGWGIVASGGTAAVLREAGLDVTDVSDLTGYPPVLDHRVVTLHPRIHAGILGDPHDDRHRADMRDLGVQPFGLVVVNLYPFEERPDIETIDIGGSALMRAAAKNHASVGVVTSPTDYPRILEEVRSRGQLSATLRQELAAAAFARSAAYEASVASWMARHDGPLPASFNVNLIREDPLRYGENPDQAAARYRGPVPSWWEEIIRHGGPPLSYQNLADADTAWNLVHDLGTRPAVAIIKHGGPCGVGQGDSLASAYVKALACDRTSAFGGVVGLNRRVDGTTADLMIKGPIADVIIAPGFAEGVVDGLARRRSATRILEASSPRPQGLMLRRLTGGWLGQEPAQLGDREGWRVVSQLQPEGLADDASLAWVVASHTYSNAVVMVKDGAAWGIAGGQPSRVGAVRLAAEMAAGRAAGGVCASDGFFPFADGVEMARSAGVRLIVQPGGSVNDAAVVATADRLGMGMIFTGERRFRH